MRRDIIECLKRGSVCNGGIADDCDDMLGSPEPVPCGGDSERGGKSRSRVSRAKCIRFAFLTIAKTGNSARLPKSFKAGTASRPNLVSITLMRNVEDNTVPRHIKNAMQGNRKFDHSEIRRDMPSVF